MDDNVDNANKNARTLPSDLDPNIFVKAQYINGRYISPWCHDTKKGISDVFGWLMTRKQSQLNLPNLSDSNSTIQVVEVDKTMMNCSTIPHFTWMGHASGYYHVDNVRFLTDPVWSKRSSPVQFSGPVRIVEPPIELDDIKVDVVLLSHTHYDHLDYTSAKMIGNNSLWIVPLGVKAILNNFGITNCVELDWWDTYEILAPNGNKINIIFTPSKHWTARSFFDRNTCLWGGYAVISPNHRFYFAGDTAYCSIFKAIGEHLGPFDMAAIPIGAYKPRWFMKSSHCDPNEAVQIHMDVKSKKTAAIHWGTFPLADEDHAEPALELARARIEHGVSKDEFFTMAHGETINDKDSPLYDYATVNPDLFSYYVNSYWVTHKGKE